MPFQHEAANGPKNNYPMGVRLTPEEMEELEKRLERLPGLEKWFVRIDPVPFHNFWDDYSSGSALVMCQATFVLWQRV